MASCESQEEIIKTILEYNRSGSLHLIESETSRLPKVKLLRKIWEKCKEAIDVKTGTSRTQSLPVPHPSWKGKKGNAADIALFFGHMLKHFEIDYVFRFAGYTESGVYQHVYTIAIIDNVEYVLDLTTGKFNREHPHMTHADCI